MVDFKDHNESYCFRVTALSKKVIITIKNIIAIIIMNENDSYKAIIIWYFDNFKVIFIYLMILPFFKQALNLFYKNSGNCFINKTERATCSYFIIIIIL